MDSNFNLQLNNYIKRHSQQLTELYNAVNIISTRLVDLEKVVNAEKDANKDVLSNIKTIQETLDSLDIEETIVEENNGEDLNVVNDDQHEEDDNDDDENNQNEEEDTKIINTDVNTTAPKKRGRKKKATT